MDTTWVRKTIAGKPGAWHRYDQHLTLCGRKMKGFVDSRSKTPPAEDRRCDDCEKHQQLGTRKAYRRS